MHRTITLKYLDVRWLHDNESDPVRLLSELDGQNFETRKIEVFRNGVVGYANATTSAHGAELGSAPIPPLDEINSDPQFKGSEISEYEFSAIWARAVTN